MNLRTEPLQARPTRLHLIFVFLLALGANAAYAADTNKGSGFFTMHCVSCHGTSGDSVMPGAPNFSQGEGLMQADAQLLSAIKSGKNAMPGYRGILSDEDILDVIAYLRTLH